MATKLLKCCASSLEFNILFFRSTCRKSTVNSAKVTAFFRRRKREALVLPRVRPQLRVREGLPLAGWQAGNSAGSLCGHLQAECLLSQETAKIFNWSDEVHPFYGGSSPLLKVTLELKVSFVDDHHIYKTPSEQRLDGGLTKPLATWHQNLIKLTPKINHYTGLAVVAKFGHYCSLTWNHYQFVWAFIDSTVKRKVWNGL